MYKIGLLVFMLQLSHVGFGQSATDSVKMVINSFFTAMNRSDKDALSNTLMDSAVLQTIGVKQGKVHVKNESLSAFIQTVSTMPKGAAEEKITFKYILIDGDLASAWTPYKFYYKGSFSHCGTNSFQLVRIDGLWKIQYIIDTRRKNNCAE